MSTKKLTRSVRFLLSEDEDEKLLAVAMKAGLHSNGKYMAMLARQKIAEAEADA